MYNTINWINYNKRLVFQSERAFHISIVKTVHFKMISIFMYTNLSKTYQNSAWQFGDNCRLSWKMKDQISIIRVYLNTKLLELHNTEIKLELLLNMSGLPGLLNGRATTYKQTKSTTKHVILNPEIWIL